MVCARLDVAQGHACAAVVATTDGDALEGAGGHCCRLGDGVGDVLGPLADTRHGDAATLGVGGIGVVV
jgi:hypothetical protein